MSQYSKNLAHTSTRKQLGDTGEQLVITQLKSNGFSILEKNYRKRFGEVDIIAQKEAVLAFVEVKLRKKTYFTLSEVITPSKQRKIIKTAKTFILERNMYAMLYRFDVALVTYDGAEQPDITYIENAFTDMTY